MSGTGRTTPRGRVTAGFVLAALAATAAALATSPATTLTSEQRAEMLTAHNAWREQVGVPGLRWSDALGASAASWAAALAQRGCRLRPGPPPGVGQNLFYASAVRRGADRSVQAVTPAEIVAEWASEVRDYSASRHACAPGRVCGHYTQLVWRTTTDVGCGVALCPDLGQIWVCDYRPAGNVAGRRPY